MVNNIPKKQRALVLQGGGALGAYEAGVFKALCEKIPIKDKESGEEGRPLFDIVAGTSIGAINSTILISHVLEKRKAGFDITKSWEDSVEKLLKFWEHISSKPNFTRWRPFFSGLWFMESDVEKSWISTWDKMYEHDKTTATGETARRYYSTKEYLYHGAPKVFSPLRTKFDSKFYDNFSIPVNNQWVQYSNDDLKESIERFATFPIIKKSEEDPRLLIVSVDVEEGETVTFDSYSKETKYGYNKTSKKYDITIDHKSGLNIEHILASASVPVHYDYIKIKTAKTDITENPTDNFPHRYFWDGGILSNTPLRELIGQHKLYWENKIGSEKLEAGLWEVDKDNVVKVPDLDVYVVNIWPTKENKIRLDHDGVKDRKNDLIYHNKTHYDEKVAYLVSDYLDLAKKLLKLAKEKGASKDEIENILHFTGRSSFRTEEERKYRELLKGRFQVNVKRIERQDDDNNISNKWFDFTSKTISNLIDAGYKEGCKYIESEH